MYTKQILSSTTSIQTKYLTSGSKFILDLKKASQSGRSMVEMLGVLGIIGLLSVGGIAAYQYLFSVSEANRISNKILTDYNRLISTAGRRLVVPEDFSDYAFVLGEDKQTLTVTVDNLESEEVAQELMTNMGTMVSDHHKYVDDETGKLTVTLTFDIPNRRGGGRVNRPLIPDNAYWEEDDKGNLYQTSCPALTLTACTQAVAGRDGCNVVQEMPDGTECGAEETGYSKMCFHGQCFKCQTAITDEQLKKGICSIEITAPCKAATLTAEGETCGNEHGTCTDGVCKCNPPWEGVDCATCGLVCQNGGTPNEDCSACDCPSNRTGEDCSTCAENWTGDNCDVCELSEEDCPIGFEINQDTCSYECSLTIDDCGSSQNIDSEHCLCVCKTEGLTGYYCSYSCPTVTGSVSGLSKSACEACGDEYIWSRGYCYGCGSSSGFSFDTEAEAEACVTACADSGYERYQGVNYCYPATNTTCPLVKSFKSSMSKSACEACDNAFWNVGYCYGCGYSGGISYSTEAEAEACEAACSGSGYNRIAEGRYCHIPTNTTCPSITSARSKMSKSVCEACDNAFWKNGTCSGCGYSSGISFDTEAEAEECEAACSGSGYNRIAEGTYCYLPTNTICPSATSSTSNMSKSVCEACGNTFWNNGTCYGCGYSSSILYSTEAKAEACVTACADSGYNRIAEGIYCYLANTTCPSITSFTSYISKSDCDKCENTVWTGVRCYGCGYSSSISYSTEAEAEACVTACADSGYNRIAEGRYCYIPTNTTCPSITSATSKMSKSVCEACDNTFWNGGTCYGCGRSTISFDTEAEAEACASACADTGYPREVDKSGSGVYYCSRK